MYIGGARTNTKAQGQSTGSGALGAPGAAPTLSADALKRAVSVNRAYALGFGWKNYTDQIAVRLGIVAKNPDIWSFVQALANWQARNGRMPTGILGGEWYDLLTRNR